MRMLVDGPDDQTADDPSLLRVIARAHDNQGRLIQNTNRTVHDIAREERVTAADGSLQQRGKFREHEFSQSQRISDLQLKKVRLQGL
jgi:hypothetical protein